MTAALPCPHGDHALSLHEVEGHVGYACGACRGAWLPRSELQSIGLKRHFSVERFESLLSAQPAVLSSLSCPKHCGALQRSRIKGIDLDWCPTCHGVWFDRGEVAKLLVQYPGQPRKGGVKRDLDAGDVFDIADLVCGVFDLLS